MGVSSLDRKCIDEKKQGEAGKRRGKSGAAKDTKDAKETGAAKNDESVPVDLGDYKGARKVLRHAVKAVVKVKSAAIAEKLVGKVEEGDMRGTEMVLSLIEKKKKQGKERKEEKAGRAELGGAAGVGAGVGREHGRRQGSGVREQGSEGELAGSRVSEFACAGAHDRGLASWQVSTRWRA